MALAQCKRWPRACDAGCADSYKTDRRMGLIYGQIRVYSEDGSYEDCGWNRGSTLAQTCVYCGADLPESGSAPVYRR